MVPIDWWRITGVRAGFTSRIGGFSDPPYESLNLGLHVGDRAETVLANREQLARAVGVSTGSFVYPRQVHGVHVAVVGRDDRGRGAFDWSGDAIEADALVTADTGTPLVVLVADCVPLILFDPEIPAIGVVHAGWKGTALGVAANTVERMRDTFGSRPESIRAVIGPSIAGDSYKVGDEVVEAMRKRYERVMTAGPDPILSIDPSGKPRIDLRSANVRDLVENAGLDPDRIDSNLFAADTFTSTRHFSHRRDGETGRFAAFAVLP
jgi:YfiH family protein